MATVAPWALGVGLLVSFTATAGINLDVGISATGRDSALVVDLGGLVPPSAALLTRTSPAVPAVGFDASGGMRSARLHVELPEHLHAAPVEIPPRFVLKQATGEFPAVDRSRKGDPLVTLRPSLSRRGGEFLRGPGSPVSRLMFRKDEHSLPSTVLMPGAVQPPDAENVFTPWAADEAPTTTQPATAARSPEAAASGSTGSWRGTSTTPSDGRTPSVPRAVALSSTTPAPADATPIEIAAMPVSPRLDRGPAASAPDVSTVPRNDPDRPNYAEGIDPDTMGRERHCLAQAVYFEARSEPEEGQAAVAQVVLNRTKSGLYPPSVCGVVFQNRHRYKACQFTFTCEGKALRITDQDSWAAATRIAREVLEGKTYLAEVGSSTHYHADYVRPRWARKLRKMDVIGRHIFYKLRSGQT